MKEFPECQIAEIVDPALGASVWIKKYYAFCLASAPSALIAEVGRIEAGLHASGVKPISFLEGLGRTLNAQKVRTNSFGRSILMAGILSVSWHMNHETCKSTLLESHKHLVDGTSGVNH